MFHLSHEDAQAYHVRHPNGSIVPVPKKGTPAHVLEAVKHLPRMAEGGEVKEGAGEEKPSPSMLERLKSMLPHTSGGSPPSSSPSVFDAAQKIGQHNKQLEDAANAEKMAEGGEAGEEPQGYPNPDALANPQEPPPDLAAPPSLDFPQNPFFVDAGGGDQDRAALLRAAGNFLPIDNPADAAAQAQSQPQGATGQQQDTQQVPELLRRPPEQDPAQAVAQMQAEAGVMPFPAPPSFDPQGKVPALFSNFLSEGREGARLQAQAQAQQAKELEGYYSDYQKKLATIEERRVAAHNGAAAEYANAIDDVKNARVDPTRFWDSRTTGQKISATIGMILGGIGSAITGQPNAALQVIDRAIERDIDSQKANIGQKNNLVSMLYQKLGSVDAAANAARMYLYGDVAAKVHLAAARAGTPQAEATRQLLDAHMQAQALGPMMQYINGQYNAQKDRVGFQMQRNIWGALSGGGQQGEGYVPSVSAPVFTGDVPAYLKDRQERRIDWIDANGNRRFSYAKPGQAKDANDQLGELSQVREDIQDLKKIASQASVVGSGVPWSAVRAKWDAIQGHFSMLSPNALSAVKRMSETELGIGKKESGESIWHAKLNNGAALDATLGLLQRRQDAILRSQGVNERSLGAGGVPASAFVAPAR